MKILFVVTLLVSIPLFALDSGRYDCINGNEDSICPQQIITIKEDNKLVGIKVYYAGYCNNQGPYRYECKGTVCTDGQIEFSKITSDSYHWENLGYNYTCYFKKQKKVKND